MKKIVLTGGGTAGHVIPNLAIVPELKKNFGDIRYIGGDGIEEKLVKNSGIPFYKTDTVKLDRSNILSNIKIPIILPKSVIQARRILKEISPDVVFSKGGYAALPTCIAAKTLKIPIICHESDYSLGLANKIVSGFATKTLTSFPETKGGIFTGNPVREEFFKNTPGENGIAADPNRQTVMFFGGSLGASAINTVVYNALPELLKNYNVIHICGKYGNTSIKAKDYYQFVYTDKICPLMKQSDIIVCRAGSNTLSEVASLGKLCIAVPLPCGASRGDQLDNAKSYRKRGYCEILLQDELCVESLLAKINAIKSEKPNILKVDKINENIVKEILSILQ